jgi:hypothetical protein
MRNGGNERTPAILLRTGRLRSTSTLTTDFTYTNSNVHVYQVTQTKEVRVYAILTESDVPFSDLEVRVAKKDYSKVSFRTKIICDLNDLKLKTVLRYLQALSCIRILPRQVDHNFRLYRTLRNITGAHI